MCRFLVLLFCVLLVFGCARTTRQGIISQELPLTVDDLSEIRAGEMNHEKVLEEYKTYQNPRLEKYVNEIAANIAAVSTRPHLPYRAVLLDEEGINVFGGPGGFIYMTRGFFDFVKSESELAGVIAHEIAHVANYEYSNIPHVSKVKYVYDALLRGSEVARDTVGAYGKMANIALRETGRVAPRIARRFTLDQEIGADEKATVYLVNAGYDPRGLESFTERLARVEMDEVGKFVAFLNSHPPFQDRRRILENKIKALDLQQGKVEFKEDLLNEVRQTLAENPQSIIFEPPRLGLQLGTFEMEQFEREREEKLTPPRRRGWF